MGETDPGASSETVASLWARLAAAERTLSARDKTIEALVTREKDRAAKRYSIFSAMEENAALQQVVAAKTVELEAQKRNLEISEERFSKAFEYAPIGVALVAPDGRWLKVNRAICELVGYSEAELLTRTSQDMTHPEDLGDSLENRRRLTDGEVRSYQIEKRYIHRHGHFVAVLLDVSLVRDGLGQPLYLIAQVQDITARKRAAAELQWKTALLEAQVDSTLDGILVVDHRHRQIIKNERFNEVWKIPSNIAADLDDQKSREFTTSQTKHPRQFVEKIDYLFSHPDEISRDEIDLLDGRVLDRYSAPVRDKAGKFYGRIWTFRDVTETKRAQAELEHIHNQLLETSRQAGMAEVATAVLHNVGNVLNSVNVASLCVADVVRKSRVSSLGRVVAMLREQEGNLGAFFTADARAKQLPTFLAQLADHLADEQSTVLDELAQLQKNIEHIKEIVAMQQSFARVSGVTETLQIAELVEDTLRLNGASLTNHEVKVECDFAEVPPVTVEKHKVLQILVNLVRNAKHACDASARPDKLMKLRVFNGDGWIKVSVSDNGVGIPPENLARIFNHGFTTKKEGHGFGLHSGALAARQMGGTLRVESEGSGRGATFTLELPATPSVETS